MHGQPTIGVLGALALAAALCGCGIVSTGGADAAGPGDGFGAGLDGGIRHPGDGFTRGVDGVGARRADAPAPDGGDRDVPLADADGASGPPDAAAPDAPAPDLGPPTDAPADAPAPDLGPPTDAPADAQAPDAPAPDLGGPTDAPGDAVSAPDALPPPDAPTPDLPVPDAATPDVPAPDTGPPPVGCDFTYASEFVYDRALPAGGPPPPPDVDLGGPAPVAAVAHAEPAPRYLYGARPAQPKDGRDIVLPGYDDNLPRFERATAWQTPTRCYETPTGGRWLHEGEAYALYAHIATATTGVALDQRAGVRSMVGLRGAYPGTFAWHGNLPNRFNDTLVLLWRDADLTPHVREFPANTDTGAYDFGVDSSSSLRPNRRYRYENGWHRDYNALAIVESGYRVRDDTNHNGHWDSDRNGWLPPTNVADHDRAGSEHNIHMGAVDAPLGTAPIDTWSAGCQVIPGSANWLAFITAAWTNTGASVDYFLIDVRDIAPEVFAPCTPDGSPACPFPIAAFPFTAHDDTSLAATSNFDGYNCSPADESGPEVVYVFTTDRAGTLSVAVDCADPVVDIDVHLLDGADARACLARDHWSFDYDLSPGRYWIVADSYAEDGNVYAGPYTLTVTFE